MMVCFKLGSHDAEQLVCVGCVGECEGYSGHGLQEQMPTRCQTSNFHHPSAVTHAECLHIECCTHLVHRSTDGI